QAALSVTPRPGRTGRQQIDRPAAAPPPPHGWLPPSSVSKPVLETSLHRNPYIGGLRSTVPCGVAPASARLVDASALTEGAAGGCFSARTRHAIVMEGHSWEPGSRKNATVAARAYPNRLLLASNRGGGFFRGRTPSRTANGGSAFDEGDQLLVHPVLEGRAHAVRG